jgi:hypothetical protein
MPSPTARTLALLREHGYHVGVVERFCHITKRRHDLFGCIDVVAVSRRPWIHSCTLGIQVTSGSNGAARVKKIKTEAREGAEAWLMAGNRLFVHAWSKRKKKRGGKAYTWECREVEITLADLEAA